MVLEEATAGHGDRLHQGALGEVVTLAKEGEGMVLAVEGVSEWPVWQREWLPAPR
jgi:hypothetical protein